MGMLRPLNIAVAALLVAAISPVLLVELPAMPDYLNHLARMHVLAAAGTPDANPFYEVRTALYPNLAMDLLVPPLARLIGVDLAGKVFVVACQLLIVTGATALELVVKRRHALAGLSAVMVLYSFPFAWGFLNFQFGLGIALLGLAAWHYLRPRSLGACLVSHALFVAALYLAHLFALGLYAVILGFIELSHVRRNQLDEAVKRFAVLGTPMLVALAAILAPTDRVGNGETEWEAASKLRSVFRALNGYSVEVGAIEAAVLIGTFYVLFRTGRLSLTRTGLWLFGGLLLVFLATPYRVLGTAYVDVRVPVVMLLVLPAFISVSMTRLAAQVAAVVPIGIALVNVAMTTALWLDHQNDFAKLRSSFALLERPSLVLVGRTIDGPEQRREHPMHHAPTLAVTANAMVTMLYALPGMQPISVVKEHRDQAIADIIYYSPVPLSLLARLAGAADARAPRFVRLWTREFDYLYLVGPRIQNPFPDLLAELAGGEQFALYRIKSGTSPSAGNGLGHVPPLARP
jgi:hypothetical protein